MTDEITKLPVRFRKKPGDDRTLLKLWEVRRTNGCHHTQFVVDEQKDSVECAACGERLKSNVGFELSCQPGSPVQ